MKKLFCLLFAIGFLAGCEIGFHPRHGSATVSVVPVSTAPAMCIEDYYEPYPSSWAYHCDSACCYYELYDNGWTCEETWCYDYDYCSWDLVNEFCY
jgi:hypothetical protein